MEVVWLKVEQNKKKQAVSSVQAAVLNPCGFDSDNSEIQS